MQNEKHDPIIRGTLGVKKNEPDALDSNEDEGVLEQLDQMFWKRFKEEKRTDDDKENKGRMK